MPAWQIWHAGGNEAKPAEAKSCFMRCLFRPSALSSAQQCSALTLTAADRGQCRQSTCARNKGGCSIGQLKKRRICIAGGWEKRPCWRYESISALVASTPRWARGRGWTLDGDFHTPVYCLGDGLARPGVACRGARLHWTRSFPILLAPRGRGVRALRCTERHHGPSGPPPPHSDTGSHSHRHDR